MMPRRLRWLAIVCGVVVLGSMSGLAARSSTERSGSDPDPTGIWWVEGGAARVEIVRCADAICGEVIWLRSPFDMNGCPLTDIENPDPERRDREVVGLTILKELRPVPNRPGSWSNGKIYDPGSGRSYRSSVRQASPDRLDVRGFVGFELLGRTSVWQRYGAALQCTARESSDRTG